jgi:hypothetical protein
MPRSEIQHHFPTLHHIRHFFTIRLPRLSRLSRRTWVILAMIVVVILVDGVLALRRREYVLRRRDYLERASAYRALYVRSVAAEQNQLKVLKGAEGASAGFEQAIAEAERQRDAAADGPERRKWEERLKERRSLLAYDRNEVVPGQRASAAKATAQRVYLQGLLNKYVDAASHPWRSVPPDPPPPE